MMKGLSLREGLDLLKSTQHRRGNADTRTHPEAPSSALPSPAMPPIASCWEEEGKGSGMPREVWKGQGFPQGSRQGDGRVQNLEDWAWKEF